MHELALLPVGALVCAGCARRPETCAWAEYENNQAVHEVCEDCWTGYCKGVAPREPQSKGVVANMLKTNAASRDRVWKWKKHLENRGALSPAIGATAIPNSVSRKVSVGMEWVEERKIHPLEDLKARYPHIDWEKPPCSVCTVNNARKQPQKVVLTEMPGSEPVLRVYCKTEIQMDEHFLSPDTMLRAGQGDEFFRQQLASMAQMVPFSSCESESALKNKLSSYQTPPSGTCVEAGSACAMDVDPLLEPGEVAAEAGRVSASNAAQHGGGAGSGGDGSAVSPADAGRGRRLRANTSNPEAPSEFITPAKKSRASSDGFDAALKDINSQAREKAEEGRGRGGRGRGRGGGGKGGRRASSEASQAKLTKATAVPLTLENVLGGKVNQPRVQLGWRKAEKPKSHKCDVHNEAKELQQLAAAVTLLPEELGQQTEQEISENAHCVEEKLDRARWPWFTWQALLNRRLQNMLASQDWTSFLASVWSWGQAPEAAAVTLDILRPTLLSITAVLSQNGDDTFLRDPLDRAKFVRDWLVKDALADLMSKNEQGIAGILALYELVQGKPQPTEQATDKEKAIYDEATGAVAALAGLVQEGPATVNQLSALRALMSQDVQSESALSLSSAFEAAYWQERVKSFWEFAVDEVMIGPQMSEVIEGLKSSTSEVVGEKWHMAMSSYNQWAAKQRQGRTAGLARALVLWCRHTAEQLCSGEASEEWVTLAEQVRSRSKWVEDVCAMKVGDALVKLNDIYNSNYGKVQVSVVVGLMSQWTECLVASREHGGADSPADAQNDEQQQIQAMVAKLDACNGLVIAEKDAPVVEQFLQELASNIATDAHAKLGLMVTTLLPVDDASSRAPHMDSSAWEHAICGWEFAAVAQGGAASLDDASRLTSLAAKWEKGGSQHAEFVQHPKLQADVQAAITSGRDMFGKMVRERMKALQDAMGKLEQCAGGKDDQGSWKSGLKDDSTWDDVQREAQYFLQRKPEEGPLHKHLDKVFEHLNTAQSQLAAADAGLKVMRRLMGDADPGDMPAELNIEELSRKARAVEVTARITHTESYFYQLLTGNAKDRATKIQSRITEMAKHGVSTSSLQTLLWRKALAVSTARK